MQLRPHQQRAFAAMQENNAGQIIIPTGGGKTYIMIADAINQLKSGPKTIVVAPRILLANQLCEEFMEFVSVTFGHTFATLTVVKLTTSAALRATRLLCLLTLLALLLSPALYSPPIILCTVL